MRSFVLVNSSRIKKVALWALGILFSPILLFLILTVLLYIPPIQNWAVHKACDYASEQTGVNIDLERVRISFLFDIDLQELTATNPDTLLDVEHVVVDLNFKKIFSGHLGVDALDIRNGSVDTQNLIPTTVIKGHLGNFHLNADDIALKEQSVNINMAQLDSCDLDIAMVDTTIVDTTESAPVLWKFKVGDVQINDTRLAFHMPGDTLSVQMGVRQLNLKGGDVNLGTNIYKAEHVDMVADSILYDQNFEPRLKKGFDYNHVAARDVNLDANDVYYSLNDSDLRLHVKDFKGREQCGFEVSSLSSHVRLDSTSIHLPDMKLYTPQSSVEGKMDLDWDALTPGGGGNLNTSLNANVAKSDIVAIAGNYLDREVQDMIPDEPMSLELEANGNVDVLNIDRCRVMAPPMADMEFSGTVTDVLDSDKMAANLNWSAQSFDLSKIAKTLGLGDIRLPQMKVSGTTNIRPPYYEADLKIQQGKGVATVKGRFNEVTEVYAAKVNFKNINVHNFLPKDSIYTVTGNANISGRGLDIYKRSTRMDAQVHLDHVRYGHWDIDNTDLKARLRDGNAFVDLSTCNDLLCAQACADARIAKQISAANFSLDLSHIDLHALGISDKPMSASMVMHMDGSSNLKDTHQVKGSMQAVELVLEDTVYHPIDVDFAAYMDPDSIYAAAYDGDLELELTSSDGLDRILSLSDKFSTELKRQLENHYIDQAVLRSMLPTCNLHLHSGNYNPIGRFLTSMGYTYNELHFDLDSNPEQGLNGKGYIHSLNTGAVMLDTIGMRIYQDSTGVLNLNAHVQNGPKNKQVVFEAMVDAALTPQGANARVQFRDAKGRKGVDLGAEIITEEAGLRLHMTPLKPIIAYRNFTLNDDNYVLLHHDNHVEANVDLLADDGTGFKLYSTPNETALQDITLSVHDFNLGELSSVLPYMPVVGGLLAGDFHFVQEENQTSVLVDAQVKDMSYEGAQMGDVGMNAVYLPNSDGTHYVDGIVSQNGNEVMTLVGTYTPDEATGGLIQGDAALLRLPLSMANGFIPDKMAELQGYVTGEMDVSGPVSAPILDGVLMTDSMYLKSDMYSFNLRFPDDSIRVQESVLDFNRIEAYSTGANPVVLDGKVDMRDLNNVGLDMSLNADNFELINAPKTRNAVAYGKVYVDMDARLRGTLNDLILRGKLNVLGKTDVTYVLTDSPLTVNDELADLVEFVDFTDTTVVEVEEQKPQNIDMVMDISIENATQVHCLLSADGTNYVNLEGGGDLTMTYNNQKDLQLYGRYTVLDGSMNYTLMVMALRDVKLTNGSYVEWTGDIANPRLNISATERIKTTVTENNVPRSVTFDVGLHISQTLENMGLEFTLDAPDDMSLSNEIASMSAEEKGKVAVTLLATGMYITDGGSTSGLSTSNALNAFLQSQISAISSKALSTIDLNFGIDNTSTASGANQTDYNFSFAKRFWGNRISLIIGGKVSSGSEAVNTGQSIIDNVSLEYRLDKSATRYVRLYYDRDTESLLEGEVMEMGAGIVLRKKSTRLGDLFIFRKKN